MTLTVIYKGYADYSACGQTVNSETVHGVYRTRRLAEATLEGLEDKGIDRNTYITYWLEDVE